MGAPLCWDFLGSLGELNLGAAEEGAEKAGEGEAYDAGAAEKAEAGDPGK